jgi:hypothetical protein
MCNKIQSEQRPRGIPKSGCWVCQDFFFQFAFSGLWPFSLPLISFVNLLGANLLSLYLVYACDLLNFHVDAPKLHQKKAVQKIF